MQPHDCRDQAQPKSAADLFAIALQPHERLQDALPVRGWNAGAVVRDLQHDRVRLGCDAHVDAPALRHIFDGVLDQVHEHLREQLAVAASRRGVGAPIFERDLARRGFRPVEIDQLARERGEIDCFGWHIAAAALGLRDLQQRAERSLHSFELCERRFHRPARVFAQAFVLQRLFDAHTRTIERTAQVVRRAVERRAQHVGLLLDAFPACD